MKPQDLERFDESRSRVRVAGPQEAPRVAAAAAPTAAAPAALRAKEDISAVIVVHGMGQQIPFETLDSVVEGLLRADAGAGGHAPAAAPTVCFRRVGNTDLPRAELELHGPHGTRRVHLYEAYWATLTEGRVRLTDVMGFLVGGAWNGLCNAWNKQGFQRWMFGHFVPLTKARNTTAALSVAALVLLSLVALNAVTTLVFASAVLKDSSTAWLDATAVAGCTATVLAMFAGLGLLALLLFTTRRMACFWAMLVLIVLAAAALLAVLITSITTHRPIWPGAAPDWASRTWLVTLVWSGLAGLSWFVRGLLVQYVGDVAVYVASHRLDRFAKLRQEIKDTVCGVLQPVYRHGTDGHDTPYARIAVVGHSLGSVAAYDALNAAINADHLDNGGRWQVVDRTCLLLTFGSPLDKTAFLFKAQGHSTGETREALAAAVQPLIQDYGFRSFPWVNVWSPADIVSGHLDYYDGTPARLPDESEEAWNARLALAAARKVTNLQDPEAVKPLVAHTQYWQNPTVFEQLRQRLVG